MSYDLRIRDSRILIVDAAVANTTMLENVLHRMGYKAVKALNEPEEVFAVVDDWKPELIVLELAMPRVNGFEVMELLRNGLPREAWIPILILSSDCTAVTKRKALAGGASEFLPKPLDSSELVLRIRNLLLMRILQSELLQQNKTLEERVTERTKALAERSTELEEALEKLKSAQQSLLQQERLRAFSELAGGVAHDFGNILNCVVGYSELMLSDPAVLDQKETLLEFAQTMNTAGRDGARIVGRLRNFYRSRDETDCVAAVDLNSLLEEVVAVTRPKWNNQALAEGRTIAINLELAAIPPVVCNASEMRELTTNLVFNAVDAMPNGGTITLVTQRLGEAARFGVRDTGTGMTEEVRQRCLEPFFSTKGERGTGLGLAMVFGIVQRHGGAIDIESKPGEGTTVWVTLAAAADAEDQTEEAVLANRPLRVLAVDDNPTARDLVRRYLIADGHSVQLASTAIEALPLLSEETFDLLIVDHAMPGMTGTELAQSLSEKSERIPVILLTATGPAQLNAASPLPGVDRVVAKPLTQEQLRRLIYEVTRPTLPEEVTLS